MGEAYIWNLKFMLVVVGSEPTGNSLSHSEKVFNSFIGIIKRVWTFTFHRWAAIVGECYRRFCLQFTVKKKKYSIGKLLTHQTLYRENHINFKTTV